MCPRIRLIALLLVSPWQRDRSTLSRISLGMQRETLRIKSLLGF